MPTPAQVRAVRLRTIELMLVSTERGHTKSEIARKLGINRSTAGRDITTLEEQADIPIIEEDGRYRIDRLRYRFVVRLDVHESMALHLATRLMATNTDRHNRHAAAAMRAVAVALQEPAPIVSRQILGSAEAMESEARKKDKPYLLILECLTEAMSRGYPVDMQYQGQDQRVQPFTFEPYALEPYAVGRSVYAIGHVRERGALRTLKLERILRAELRMAERYELPQDFSPANRLAGAWGIWASEEPAERVVLRFSAEVAKRVRETQWHASERTRALPDGRLEWRAEVAEWREMLHWIRGWGSEVEAVAPAELREAVAEDARRMAGLYG